MTEVTVEPRLCQLCKEQNAGRNLTLDSRSGGKVTVGICRRCVGSLSIEIEDPVRNPPPEEKDEK